ncbi:hypothetical protein [Nocardia abscessus]|uniref:hypothetical protein n=1 Tax=Nocardia abscessus TaxID=120957 RepID=UPI0024554CAB|nr:hypothetical protein [Nocardia abscessus]
MAELTDGTYKIINCETGDVMALDPRDRVGVLLAAPNNQGDDYAQQFQEWTVQTAGDGEFVLSSKLTGVQIAPKDWASPIECQGRPGWKWFLGDPGIPDRATSICLPVDDPGEVPLFFFPIWEGQDARHIMLSDDPGLVGPNSFWRFQAV